MTNVNDADDLKEYQDTVYGVPIDPPTLDLLVAPICGGSVPLIGSAPFDGDAGIDLVTRVAASLWPGQSANIPCGVAVALPPGTFGLVYTRSSTWTKKGLIVVSTVIDEGWRGELSTLVFRPFQTGHPEDVNYSQSRAHASLELPAGTRLAQLLVLPNLMNLVEVHQVEELPESERGVSGYGSSG